MKKQRPIDGTKACNKCHERKPFDAVHFSCVKGRPSGATCRPCRNARNKQWRAANPEKQAAAVKAWEKANPEKTRAKGKRWYDKNKSKAQAIALGSYQRNKARAQATARAWKRRNRARNLELLRSWRAANPASAAMYAHRRRARILAAGGTFTVADVERQFSDQQGRCFYCRETLTKFHVDHKTPISRGGSNGPENIAIACPFCNLSKGARTEAEFRVIRAAATGGSSGELAAEVEALASLSDLPSRQVRRARGRS